MALFFWIPALIFTLLASTNDRYLVWWLALAFALSMAMFNPARGLGLSPLFIACWAWVAALLYAALVVNPVFPVTGVFALSFFVAGFYVFSELRLGVTAALFRVAVLVFAALAVWGLVQFLADTGYLVRYGARANTLFTTPNRFAAALNLVLLPLIALYLAGHGIRLSLVFILLLFAGLVATESRGGWIAFAVGLMAMAWLMRRMPRSAQPGRWRGLLAGLALVFATVIGAKAILAEPVGSDVIEQIQATLPFADAAGSVGHRFMLYRIAWDLIRERPLMGYGYRTFGVYQDREQDAFFSMRTDFVHNDYLQIWMEAGIAGLLSLFAMIGFFYWQSIAALRRLDGTRGAWLLALLSALTASFAHAMVDYLLYVPALLFGIGACLAIANRITTPHFRLAANLPFGRVVGDFLKRRHGLIRLVAGAAFLAWLAKPAFAQLAFIAGEFELGRNNQPLALTLFELARRFAPYEAGYYHTEGMYWLEQAALTGSRAAAANADRLFALGASVNPFDVENRLARARLNSEFRALLDRPAPWGAVLLWLEEARAWRPRSAGIHEAMAKVKSAARDSQEER